MNKSKGSSGLRSCKIADNISITVNLEDESSNSEYRRFCNKLKMNNSLYELSEEDKLKLFLLSSLMAPSFLNNLIKDRSHLVIPNKCGILTLRGLGSFDTISVKGNGEEIWKSDSMVASVLSLYDLSLRLSNDQKFNHDFIYHFLMNLGSRMKWTQNPKAAKIFSSCVSDVSEKLCKNKFADITTLRYVGRIDWQRLKDAIKTEFGASIKVRRSDYSDVWNVYIDTLESIFQCDIKQFVSARKAISKGEWVEDSLKLLVDEINHKYDIDVKVWQVKGMICKPLSNRNLSDVLTDLVRSKRQIYPFLKD